MTDKTVSALDEWNDPHGCQDVSTAQDVIDELQARVQELEEIKAIHDHIESKLHRSWLYELAVSLGYEEAKSNE